MTEVPDGVGLAAAVEGLRDKPEVARPVAGLLLELPRRGRRRVLTRLEEAAR
jgi:hypothetical protein